MKGFRGISWRLEKPQSSNRGNLAVSLTLLHLRRIEGFAYFIVLAASGSSGDLRVADLYTWRQWGAPAMPSISYTCAIFERLMTELLELRNRSAAYSLIRFSLRTSIHASYSEGNALENLRVALIPLWHLQLTFPTRKARHARASRDRWYGQALA